MNVHVGVIMRNIRRKEVNLYNRKLFFLSLSLSLSSLAFNLTSPCWLVDFFFDFFFLTFSCFFFVGFFVVTGRDIANGDGAT